jgi:hypothetical protein
MSLTKAEIKDKAQRYILGAIQQEIFLYEDDDQFPNYSTDLELAQAMRVQARRVMKLLGFEEFGDLNRDNSSVKKGS